MFYYLLSTEVQSPFKTRLKPFKKKIFYYVDLQHVGLHWKEKAI